ncbi:hypothetical protein B0H12DRAFT_1239587 [Mycena haematopus]|nr:hypothetical protein B0H12DRAFT_1239587 [Mycena haematopus]
MSGRRTLRSGKEFSAFDLAVQRAIVPATDFDLGECLQRRLADQDATDASDDEAEEEDHYEPDEEDHHAVPDPPPTPIKPAKVKGTPQQKARGAGAASTQPHLKAIHRKRVAEAKASALKLDLDAAALPHSKPAWVGSRSAGDEPFEFTEPAGAHDLTTGLGGVSYTQEEVDALSGTLGFMYIAWLGTLTIPLLDCHRRIIALLGSTPRDVVGWKVITDARGNFFSTACHAYGSLRSGSITAARRSLSLL